MATAQNRQARPNLFTLSLSKGPACPELLGDLVGSRAAVAQAFRPEDLIAALAVDGHEKELPHKF